MDNANEVYLLYMVSIFKLFYFIFLDFHTNILADKYIMF